MPTTVVHLTQTLPLTLMAVLIMLCHPTQGLVSLPDLPMLNSISQLRYTNLPTQLSHVGPTILFMGGHPEVMHMRYDVNVNSIVDYYWPHLKGELYLSSAYCTSSSTLTSVPPYYTGTNCISSLLGSILKSVWSNYFTAYTKVFTAGHWFLEDPGPFLGHILVYKLQVHLHLDKNDAGPTTCFPVGTWKKDGGGGCLLVPQPRAKFQSILATLLHYSFPYMFLLFYRYDTGHVAIFFSNHLLYKVAP